jgi:hypothetical protein
MTISVWIIIRMRIVLDKPYRENKTQFMFNNFFNHAVYETMSKK